jgi:hypothetical protein
MFSRFQSIVNKVNANRSADALEYTEHEKALKLLYALDRSVWDLKVNTIIESAGYETLTVNELFSKLKATEVDNQTRAKLNGAPPSKSIALVTGPSGTSSNANSALGFSLASLPSVTDEQLEMLGDDDLCLLISKFQRIYHNRQRKKNPGATTAAI